MVYRAKQHKQSGFSLVELMVALILGLLVLAGILQVYVSSKATYNTTEGLGRIQENARFALESMNRTIRQAGNQNFCAGFDLDITDHLNPGGDGYDSAVGNFTGGQAALGWDYAGTEDGADITLTSQDPADSGAGDWTNGLGDDLPERLVDGDPLPLPGSDVLVIRAVIPGDTPVTGCSGQNASSTNLDACDRDNVSIEHGQPKNSVIMMVDCATATADLFQSQNNPNADKLNKAPGSSSNPGPGNLNGSNWTITPENAQLYRLESTAFYVGLSRVSGRPALFRHNLSNNIREELVEGVESLQLQFGLGNEGQVNDYVSPNSVPDWSQVVSVRYAMLMASDGPVTGEVDTVQYDMLDTGITPIQELPQSARLRQTVGSSVAIRSRQWIDSLNN